MPETADRSGFGDLRPFVAAAILAPEIFLLVAGAVVRLALVTGVILTGALVTGALLASALRPLSSFDTLALVALALVALALEALALVGPAFGVLALGMAVAFDIVAVAGVSSRCHSLVEAAPLVAPPVRAALIAAAVVVAALVPAAIGIGRLGTVALGAVPLAVLVLVTVEARHQRIGLVVVGRRRIGAFHGGAAGIEAARPIALPAVAALTLRGLRGRIQDAKVMLGVLEIAFCHHAIARTRGVAPELQVFLEQLLGGSANAEIRARTVENVVPIKRDVAAVVADTAATTPAAAAATRAVATASHTLHVHACRHASSMAGRPLRRRPAASATP